MLWHCSVLTQNSVVYLPPIFPAAHYAILSDVSISNEQFLDLVFLYLHLTSWSPQWQSSRLCCIVMTKSPSMLILKNTGLTSALKFCGINRILFSYRIFSILFIFSVPVRDCGVFCNNLIVKTQRSKNSTESKWRFSFSSNDTAAAFWSMSLNQAEADFSHFQDSLYII